MRLVSVSLPADGNWVQTCTHDTGWLSLYWYHDQKGFHWMYRNSQVSYICIYIYTYIDIYIYWLPSCVDCFFWKRNRVTKSVWNESIVWMWKISTRKMRGRFPWISGITAYYLTSIRSHFCSFSMFRLQHYVDSFLLNHLSPMDVDPQLFFRFQIGLAIGFLWITTLSFFPGEENA